MDKTFIGKSVLFLAAVSSIAAAPAAATDSQDERSTILTAAVPSVPGPKRTIAVGPFDVIGPYANSSANNVGGAISAMLSTALQESSRFVMVERNALPSLVTEQELAKSGVAAGNAAPQPGSVIPAQYLVVGSVTEFTTPGSGQGSGLSLGGPTSLSLGNSQGVLGLDVRIVDTRTSQVIRSFKVRQKASASTLAFNSSWKGVPIATNHFFNTPVGVATRRALNDAVSTIAQTIAQIPWSGQVVEVDGDQVFVNAGSEGGVNVGDVFAVQHAGKVFTDPATGQVLSRQMATLGTIRIIRVEPKLAAGTFESIPSEMPVRGDLVVYAR